MKSRILFLMIAFSATIFYAQNNPNDIIGKWLKYDKSEIVEILPSNNQYIGNIVWLKESNNKNGNPKKDYKNPDKKLNEQQVLGSQNIFGLQFKEGKWQNGKIYSYERGGTIKFKVVSITKTKLVVKITIGFFSKKIIYTRVI